MFLLAQMMGVIGVAAIVVKNSGVAVPAWVWQICWLVLLVVVGIVAIKFIAGL